MRLQWRNVFLGVSVLVSVAACSSGDDEATSRCGDGRVNPGEECEPTRASNCTADCRFSQCGNDLVEPSEECEPAFDSNCSADCRWPECGNGRVEPGEECEPQLDAYCSADCRITGACGDGQITALETCDDGNGYFLDGCGTACTV